MRHARLTCCGLMALSFLLLPSLTFGQSPHADCPLRNKNSGPESATSPYAGLQSRSIKALSDDQQEQLLAGHGMGLALVAELNHYPGPKHVLESATLLGLTEDQVSLTQTLFHKMQARAQALGRQIIEAEAALEADFKKASIDEARLTEGLRTIGRLEADLRAAHLSAHLEMKDALTAQQIRRYDELRGYVRPTGQD